MPSSGDSPSSQEGNVRNRRGKGGRKWGKKNDIQRGNNMKYARAYVPMSAHVPMCADGKHIEGIVGAADAAGQTGVGFVFCRREHRRGAASNAPLAWNLRNQLGEVEANRDTA